MRIYLLALILLFFLPHARARENEKYWVFFTDKEGITFDPYTYFDPKAIERRVRSNLPLSDVSDYPVKEEYIREISLRADSVKMVSRWFNAAVIYASPAVISAVSQLPFVKEIVPAQNSRLQVSASDESELITLGSSDSALLKFQTCRMGGHLFKENNTDGRGIRIAILDAGFPGVDKHPAFEHIRNGNRIVQTYDFVRKSEFVYAYSSHGSSVLSCVAGKYGDIDIGLATGASFLLARTENAFHEPFSEEENWLAAAEWADKNGADIINSSLGYTVHRYFPSEMNGRRSFVSRAAGMAAAKGILVVNAAGNEGENNWRIIGTPGDADSVLSVGGTNPYTDMHTSFSSFGPTADGRLKPEVCAPGHVIAAGKKAMITTQGTSFSSPLVAGFAACVWQMHRDWSNMQVYEALKKSGHLYPYFDYAHGYGIPQASRFLLPMLADSLWQTPTVYLQAGKEVIKIKVGKEFSLPSDTVSFNWGDGQQTKITIEIDRRKFPRRNLYYKITDNDGKLRRYGVIVVKRETVGELDLSGFRQGDKLIIHFEGYTLNHEF